MELRGELSIPLLASQACHSAAIPPHSQTLRSRQRQRHEVDADGRRSGPGGEASLEGWPRGCGGGRTLGMCDCTSAGQTAFCCFIPELPWLSTSWPVTPLLRAAHDPAKGSIPTLRFQGENVTPGLPNISHSNSAGGRARQQQQILQMFRCFCPQWSFPAGIRCKQ